ncbi:adenine phosphoribosyltransferase [Neptunicella marina]|uniref:Adenine phosphoribosyltransferase n=1 Tax=Neptunicella marina TaxID=2125989 RepID=A0A8J6IXD6_9ALTE|nr:adenine phosphoribosyltransferase [Neptunicella marina]MBC3767774.1 adenine phosphoribosyltransferase [Neptunicella marina]
MSVEQIKASIRTITDYPKPGIQFRDVTSLMANADAFSKTISHLAERYKDKKFDKIVGTEARGFIFGAPLAYALGIAFVPVRKPNKLPGAVHSQSYSLEYGEDCLEIHQDAIHQGERILMVDDLLATGGTILATANLIEKMGGHVEHAAFVISLPDLGGEQRLAAQGITSYSICQFDGD